MIFMLYSDKRKSVSIEGVALICICLFVLFTGTANAVHKYSDAFSIKIDPAMKKTLGEEVYKSVLDFYHEAEVAIETKNMDALMSLYSDQYQNGEHDKAAARVIWSRIFDTFSNLAAMHNMEFISSKDGVLIIRCSGLLIGIPKGETYSITVDTWTWEEHILKNENGKWKLIGNAAGRERKRLWFDKPMHPLF